MDPNFGDETHLEFEFTDDRKVWVVSSSCRCLFVVILCLLFLLLLLLVVTVILFLR